MSWSSGFVAALSSASKVPQWELVVERNVFGAGGTAYVSHQQLASGVPALIARAPTFSPNRITPVSWVPVGGTWSVEIAWSDPHRAITMCPRGAIVSLYCTMEGYRERMAIGIVRNLTGSPGAWRVECQNITSGLTSRLTDNADEIRLFHDLNDGDTTVAANYTAGDPTLVLTDASGLEKDSDAGALYCVLVTDNGGTQFYVIGTLAVNTITITTAGAFGTTDADADAGNAVTACAYIAGHPLDVMRKLLISGSAMGSVWDTLPAAWGLMLDGGWFGHGDINDVRDDVVVVPAGSYRWDLVFSAPLTSPWSYLQNLLSQAGIWLTMRQGEIVFRAACDPGSPPLGSVGSIGPRSLATGKVPAWSWQWQAQEFAAEYAMTRVLSGTGSTTDPPILLLTVESYPMEYEALYDLSGVVWSNEAAIRGEVGDRLYPFAIYPPEAFSLALRGWAAAAWCEGDYVTLDLADWLVGRQTAASRTYGGALAMVLEAAPDLSGDASRVRVIVFPQEV
jgi:hypothetical protein